MKTRRFKTKVPYPPPCHVACHNGSVALITYLDLTGLPALSLCGRGFGSVGLDIDWVVKEHRAAADNVVIALVEFDSGGMS